MQLRFLSIPAANLMKAWADFAKFHRHLKRLCGKNGNQNIILAKWKDPELRT